MNIRGHKGQGQVGEHLGTQGQGRQVCFRGLKGLGQVGAQGAGQAGEHRGPQWAGAGW